MHGVESEALCDETQLFYIQRQAAADAQRLFGTKVNLVPCVSYCYLVWREEIKGGTALVTSTTPSSC
jgi:hypothetical protein